MRALQEFLDNLPFPRWVVWTLAGVILVFALLPGGNRDVGYQIEKGIEARTLRVMRSMESLPVTDPDLRACIEAVARDRARIHPMNSGGIDDVREISKLYCPNRNITSLDGLGELEKLAYLEISGNRVESLAPLSNHPGIERLYLSRNPIRDIGVARSIPRLRVLSLPDLPDEDCSRLEAAFSGVETNITRIKCAGEKSSSMKTIAQRNNGSEQPKAAEPPPYERQLSDAEHAELMEYERGQR